MLHDSQVHRRDFVTAVGGRKHEAALSPVLAVTPPSVFELVCLINSEISLTRQSSTVLSKGLPLPQEITRSLSLRLHTNQGGEPQLPQRPREAD